MIAQIMLSPEIVDGHHHIEDQASNQDKGIHHRHEDHHLRPPTRPIKSLGRILDLSFLVVAIHREQGDCYGDEVDNEIDHFNRLRASAMQKEFAEAVVDIQSGQEPVAYNRNTLSF